jgi:outer membrane protein assembly factor BamB
MTVEPHSQHPIPARPAATSRRPHAARLPAVVRRRLRAARVPRAVLVSGGIALVLALALGSCELLGDLARTGGRAAGHPVRPAVTRRRFQVLSARWGVDRLADPTALLVDGGDAFVVEPYAVSSIGVGDGVTRWRVDVKDAEPWIAASADTVLVGAVDGFEALDRATGASRWRLTIEDPDDRGRTVGLVQTASGAMAVLTTQRGGVVGVDARTGATRWSATLDGSPRGQLATDDRTGLVALQMDHDERVELHVLDAASGTERLSTALGLMTGLALVDGPRLVLDTGDLNSRGTVVAFDLATGARRWETTVASSSEPGEGGIVDGDRIVIVDGLGTVSALDRVTGRRLWSHDSSMPVFHGRPIAIGDALVLRDIGAEIFVLDRRTGRHRGIFRVGGIGVGLGGGPAGIVFARSQVTHHQVVGLPPRILTMRTGTGTPPELVPAGTG